MLLCRNVLHYMWQFLYLVWFLHHLVMCEHLGITEIPRGYCVHHCDFNPHNNDIGNLVLLTVGEHSALHQALAGATTISKESTAKWLEAHRAGIRQDIVCSAQECAAARNGAGVCLRRTSNTLVEPQLLQSLCFLMSRFPYEDTLYVYKDHRS